MKPRIRPIPDFPNYGITDDGRVWSANKNGWLSPANAGGYKVAVLRRAGRKRRSFYVHRLVALTWLPNPEGKSDVNHIDGDKANNRLDNLEWATRAENQAHAAREGLLPTKATHGNWNSANYKD